MSEFLDELARSLTTAMPRRRAIRVLGGALLGMALPATRASAARATHDCPSMNAFLCQCPSINGLFYKICCPNETPTTKYECKCKAPPDGYAQCSKVTNPCKGPKCGGTCCDKGERCCPSTRLMPKSRCYDPDTQCCTPVKGVVAKSPMSKIEWCPDRKPKPGHKGKANGCGPEGGAATRIIPNRFFKANFKPGCDFHDVCYETCLRRKEVCDVRFGEMLRAECRDAYGPGLRRNVCLQQARNYFNFVSNFGDDAYEAAQRAACNCC